MLFTIGIEVPTNNNEALGLVVPALCTGNYGCYSAADTVEEIIPMATDAIHTILEMMLDDNVDISSLKDLGFIHYQQQKDFQHCNSWLLLPIDMTAYYGKRQRVNIVLPQYLINRIDSRVTANPAYKDRSHFLAIASQHELSSPSV